MSGHNRILVILTLIAISVSASASQINQAVNAYRNRDYKTAHEIADPLAGQGNSVAEYLLGLMKLNGFGEQQDTNAGISLLERAGSAGLEIAQHDLGLLYGEGNFGVVRNLPKALEWYKKAAAQGNAEATYNIGAIYENGGDGIPPDRAVACEWVERAAKLGIVEGQKGTANCYQFGPKKDMDTAIAWYKKASAQGDGEASFSIGMIYYNGTGVAVDKVNGCQWIEKSAAQGNVKGQTWSGVCYETGYGGVKDLNKARQYYELAARSGNGEARARLNQMVR